MRRPLIEAALDCFAEALRASLGDGIAVRAVHASAEPAARTVEAAIDVDGATGWLRIEPPDRPGRIVHPAFVLATCGDRPAPEPIDRRLVALARRLEALDALGDAITRLRVALSPVTAAVEPLDEHVARRSWPSDATWLTRLSSAFRRRYGQPLSVVHLPGGPPSIGFPDVVPWQCIFLEAPAPLLDDARMRAYLEDLGFAVGFRRRLSVVPLPAAFEQRARRAGLATALRAAFVPTLPPVLSARRWLRELSRGRLPIHRWGLPGLRLATVAGRVAERISPRLAASWHDHLHALGHDTSTHLWTLHRLDKSQLGSIRALCHLALRRGHSSIRLVAGALENELVRRCWTLWHRTRVPEHFDAAYERDIAPWIETLRAELGDPST
ncbi:MAG: hypothetical protein NZ898_10075 [Myxococcota bacterium]|nr:hypothetical protein [Myxococcota bacterium]